MSHITKISIDQIRDEMNARDSHWWNDDSMRFFGTRIESGAFCGVGGVYFVTSEQPPHGMRKYSVREYDPKKVDISTIGDFCSIRDLDDALELAQECANDN